jgi:hypothetical protein
MLLWALRASGDPNSPHEAPGICCSMLGSTYVLRTIKKIGLQFMARLLSRRSVTD